MMKSRGLIFLLIIGLHLMLPGLALAAGGIGIMTSPGLDGRPRSNYTFTISPGETIKDKVVINNHGDLPKRIGLEALDAITPHDSSFRLKDATDKNKFAGTWIKLSTNTVELKPNSSVEVPFDLFVPQSNPGEYAAGIVAYELNPSANEQGLQLRVRTGVRIYVKVTGHQERSLDLRKAGLVKKGNRASIDLELANNGNAPITPRVKMKLQGALGSKSHEDLSLANLNPGESLTKEEVWPNKFNPIGLYQLTLTASTGTAIQFLSDGSEQELPEVAVQKKFWVFFGSEILLGLCIFLILAGLAYRVFVFMYDRKKRHTLVVKHVVNNEDLLDIASKYRVTIQSIVRFNNLPWPYTIKSGHRLLVPSLDGKPLVQTLEQPKLVKYLLEFKPSLYPDPNYYLNKK